jgi:MFS family permease
VFFSLYLDSLGYSKTMIGLLWAVSVAVEIGWFFSQSRWLPRMPLTAWLVLCSATMLLRMGLTAAWADVLWVLLLAQALHALTFAAHHTVCIALLSHHFPGRLRGRGQALYTVIAYGFPGVIGGLLGGMLSDHLGLASVYWASLGTSAIATVVTLSASNISNGYVDITTNTLSNGNSYVFNAKVITALGTASAASGNYTVTIDTTAPMAPSSESSGVPINSVSISTPMASAGKSNCRPITGASRTRGKPQTSQCAVILPATSMLSGSGESTICSSVPSA